MTGEKTTMLETPQPGGREPAPGALALVQAFVNTRWDLTAEGQGETLVNPAALHDWLEARGLVGKRDRLDPRDLDRALAIREGLRALAFANNQHQLNVGAIDAMRQASPCGGTALRPGPCASASPRS